MIFCEKAPCGSINIKRRKKKNTNLKNLIFRVNSCLITKFLIDLNKYDLESNIITLQYFDQIVSFLKFIKVVRTSETDVFIYPQKIIVIKLICGFIFLQLIILIN